jgi:hypothetical protein
VDVVVVVVVVVMVVVEFRVQGLAPTISKC